MAVCNWRARGFSEKLKAWSSLQSPLKGGVRKLKVCVRRLESLGWKPEGTRDKCPNSAADRSSSEEKGRLPFFLSYSIQAVSLLVGATHIWFAAYISVITGHTQKCTLLATRHVLIHSSRYITISYRMPLPEACIDLSFSLSIPAIQLGFPRILAKKLSHSFSLMGILSPSLLEIFLQYRQSSFHPGPIYFLCDSSHAMWDKLMILRKSVQINISLKVLHGQ